MNKHRGNIMGRTNWSDTGTTPAPDNTGMTTDTPAGTSTAAGNPTTATQPAVPAASVTPAADNSLLSSLPSWLGMYQIGGIAVGVGYAYFTGKKSITSMALYAALGFGAGWIASEASDYIMNKP